jgi:iron-sulfur cluster assembly protein
MSDAKLDTALENPIQVTGRAVEEVKRIMEKEKASADSGLKVGVKGGGCSGLMYVMEFSSGPQKGERVFENNGIKLFVDLKSFLYLNGMTLDFSDGLNGKGFEFSNPNATKTCGCGASFGV